MGRRKRDWKAASRLSLGALRWILDSKLTDLSSRRDELSAELAEVERSLRRPAELAILRARVADPAVPRDSSRPRSSEGLGDGSSQL